MQTPQALSAQSGICDLLARLLLSEPDAELAQLVGTEAVAGILEACEPGTISWVRDFRAGSRVFEDARRDYAALFLSPGTVSPRAGQWLADDDAASRSAAEAIRTALRRLALAPANTGAWGELPPDHVALLLAAAAHGLRSPRSDAQHAADELLLAFFDPYAAKLGRELHAHASTPLYRATGALIGELAAERVG